MKFEGSWMPFFTTNSLPPTLPRSLPLPHRMWCMRMLLSMRVKVGVVHCFSSDRYTGWALKKLDSLRRASRIVRLLSMSRWPRFTTAT